jgi:hypothetical protein
VARVYAVNYLGTMGKAMNADYAAYRAHALTYYQAGGVLTTRSATKVAARRRAYRDAQIEAPLSKQVQRRINWLVKQGIMQLMPLEDYLAWSSGVNLGDG